MADKVLGVVALALSAACQVLIRHQDTALFYSYVFGLVGAFELVVGEIRQRRRSG
jgi:hypothetical protein